MSRWILRYRIPDTPFPLGEVSMVPAGDSMFATTFVREPVPYVIVLGDASSVPDEEATRTLEVVRRTVAAAASVAPTPSIPKLAVAGHGDGVPLAFRTRLADGKPWHGGAAASGLLSLAVALTGSNTIPSLIAGPLTSHTVVGTPAGNRLLVRRPDGDGFDAVEIVIDVRPLAPIGAA